MPSYSCCLFQFWSGNILVQRRPLNLWSSTIVSTFLVHGKNHMNIMLVFFLHQLLRIADYKYWKQWLRTNSKRFNLVERVWINVRLDARRRWRSTLSCPKRGSPFILRRRKRSACLWISNPIEVSEVLSVPHRNNPEKVKKENSLATYISVSFYLFSFIFSFKRICLFFLSFSFPFVFLGRFKQLTIKTIIIVFGISIDSICWPWRRSR